MCMRCRKVRQGVDQGLQGALQEKIHLTRDYAVRHPKLMILSINLIKDGKPGQKPRLEDHIHMMRQAGLR